MEVKGKSVKEWTEVKGKSVKEWREKHKLSWRTFKAEEREEKRGKTFCNFEKEKESDDLVTKGTG